MALNKSQIARHTVNAPNRMLLELKAASCIGE